MSLILKSVLYFLSVCCSWDFISVFIGCVWFRFAWIKSFNLCPNCMALPHNIRILLLTGWLPMRSGNIPVLGTWSKNKMLKRQCSIVLIRLVCNVLIYVRMRLDQASSHHPRRRPFYNRRSNCYHRRYQHYCHYYQICSFLPHYNDG